MDIKQFRDYIVVPALNHINLHSLSAEQLVMATAMAESNLTFIQQIGRGPARSFFQMEPVTHDDILAGGPIGAYLYAAHKNGNSETKRGNHDLDTHS